MTPQTSSKVVERIDDLREEIEELQRQKEKLQDVYDFSDFIETHDPIEAEIERLRQELRQEKLRLNNSDRSNSEEVEEVEIEEEDD